MNITWITIAVAFLLIFLSGFKVYFKVKKRSPAPVVDKPYKRYITVYTLECEKCNYSMCSDFSDPEGEFEFKQVTIEWNTIESKQNMFLNDTAFRCEKHNYKIMRVVSEQTIDKLNYKRI